MWGHFNLNLFHTPLQRIIYSERSKSKIGLAHGFPQCLFSGGTLTIYFLTPDQHPSWAVLRIISF